MSIIYTLTLKDRLSIFFKGTTSLIGLFFFLFGMVFFIVFGLASDFSVLTFWYAPTYTTVGTVTEVQSTNYSENDRNVQKFTYEYDVQGIKHQGHSFSSTKWMSRGETAKVEYLSNNPEVSRIQGMKRRPFSIWPAIFVSIFPLIGLVFLFYNIKKSIRHIDILQDAAIEKGKLINAVQTGTRINNRYVYRMDFEYQVYGKTYICSGRTVRPQILDDEPEEPLVYSTRNPEKAIMFDLLPRSIQKKLEAKFPILKSQHEEPPYYS